MIFRRCKGLGIHYGVCMGILDLISKDREDIEW